MNRRKGYVLLGLLLFFTVLSLSSSVAILQQDTRLKRFSENDLKANIDAFRRGIDLYRYKYGVISHDDAKLAALNDKLINGPATAVADLLAAESFIRARIATGSMKWKLVTNLVKNPSFEIDDGTDFGDVSGWRGNFTANDGTPDGWKMTDNGTEQMIKDIPAGTYVLSFWARTDDSSSEVKLRAWFDGLPVPCELTATDTVWRRYFASFEKTTPMDLKLEIVKGLTNTGNVYIDGIMLEKWEPPSDLPPGTPPVPSAWTKDITLVPEKSDQVLQKNVFRDLIPQGATPASMTWWFQW
ncbi:MAG: hypothetical protein Kow0029_12000 [Candidatus Rifleibacteriota bacterium]